MWQFLGGRRILSGLLELTGAENGLYIFLKTGINGVKEVMNFYIMHLTNDRR